MTHSFPARRSSDLRLQNQSNFPLKFHIDTAPPIVKFAAEFGILEASEGGVLPVNVRGVEASLVQANLQMPATALKVGDDDAAVARWLKRVADADDTDYREAKNAKGEDVTRTAEHTDELQSLMRISYAVFCLKKKKQTY